MESCGSNWRLSGAKNNDMASPNPSTGRALARILTGCWRENPVAIDVTEGSTSAADEVIDNARLETLLPALIGSGAGALAWRRLRHSALSGEPAAQELQKLHLRQALEAKLGEREIVRVFETLRGAGIETVLIKGWSTARLYPEAGLRAPGDIDLLVDPADKTATSQVLGVPVDEGINNKWDVKSQVPALYHTTTAALFERRQHVMMGATPIAVLGTEDHLRVLCLHFLKHGAWRPLWLCDIAAALEFRPANFSWERCLGQEPRCADAIACALGLAHQLLGASVAGTPIEARAQSLPRWMVPVVLRAWQIPLVTHHQLEIPMRKAIRAEGFWPALNKRWPNPIQAAIQLQTPLNWPPFWTQTLSFAGRSAGFFGKITRQKQPEIDADQTK